MDGVWQLQAIRRCRHLFLRLQRATSTLNRQYARPACLLTCQAWRSAGGISGDDTSSIMMRLTLSFVKDINFQKQIERQNPQKIYSLGQITISCRRCTSAETEGDVDPLVSAMAGPTRLLCAARLCAEADGRAWLVQREAPRPRAWPPTFSSTSSLRDSLPATPADCSHGADLDLQQGAAARAAARIRALQLGRGRRVHQGGARHAAARADRGAAGPPADRFMHALNLHPRIRALQVREPAQHSEIQPLLTLEDIAARRLLRIRDTSSDEEANGAWKSHVQEETMVPFNRYEELPTFLEVWADRDGQFTRLFLFSDHYMCDGFSGRAILNDTLIRVSKLSRGEVVEHMEHPLRKGPYNLLLDAYTYSTPLTEFAIKMLYNVVRSTFCSSKPLLPPRSDQADFVYPYKVNPSYARFDSGEAATLKPAVARCKEEKVSVTGAVTAAVLLAYYYASQKYKPVKFNEDFKIIMTISTDLRPRFPEKVEEDLVGNYASLVSLDRLKTSGVKFERKFWDVARQCKSDIDAALKSPTMAFSDIALDQLYEASALPKAFTPGKYVIPNSCTGDVDISNLGQYPYAMTHTLGSGKQLTIDSLHLYESVPGVAMGTLMFVSSTDKFNYSMIHKYEDEDGDVLFRAYVAFAEHIGKIDADTTMAEVFTRVKSQLDA